MSRKKKKKYTISVGFLDKDERIQKIQTEKIVRLVANCCKAYSMAFSSYIQDGGYIHDDGEYVLEKSVCIVFIDPEVKLVEEVAKDLCAFMNQESVMVTVEEVDCFYISESIDK